MKLIYYIYRKLIIFLFFLSIAMTSNSHEPHKTIAPYYSSHDIGFSYKIYPDRQGNYSNGFIVYNGTLIKNCDIATFEVLEEGYAKDKNRVYYKGETIEGVNPEVFVHLEHKYAKDTNFIFCGGIKLENIDMETFEIISDNYTKDKNAVYFNTKKIEDADPKEFSLIVLESSTNYSKDGKNIFWDDKKIEGVDYSTFEVLYNDVARDKNNTYYAGRIIDYIDPQTIEAYEYSPYISDKNGVYYILERMKKVDRATFEYLGQGYIKDQKRVYYNGKEIGGADPQTFEIYQWMHGDAKDKNGYYRYGMKLSYDPHNY